jgi:hypothetical protein
MAQDNVMNQDDMMEQDDDFNVCVCGCGLTFKAGVGLDIYIGERWLITAPKMSEHIWGNFIWEDGHKKWLELREFIIINYNNRVNAIGAQEFGPYIHLYNECILRENTIPLNAEVMFECAF